MLTIELATDNDAFTPDPAPEVARILADLAQRVARGDLRDGDAFPLRDVNGNRCGSATYTVESDDDDDDDAPASPTSSKCPTCGHRAASYA